MIECCRWFSAEALGGQHSAEYCKHLCYQALHIGRKKNDEILSRNRRRKALAVVMLTIDEPSPYWKSPIAYMHFNLPTNKLTAQKTVDGVVSWTKYQ